jgi:hypothetical protein
MKRKLNVSGDIESRRRIAARGIPVPAAPVQQAEHGHGTEEKGTAEADQDGIPSGSAKTRRRKAKGDAETVSL